MKFIILLHKVVDDYVTLFDVYESAINPDRIAEKLAEGERQLSRERRGGRPSSRGGHRTRAGAPPAAVGARHDDRAGCSPNCSPRAASERLERRTTIAYAGGDSVRRTARPFDRRRFEQFAAVKRWFQHDWMRIEPKLRTSIIEGISVFLSLFDDNPSVKYTFCPPKACYDPVANADGRYGRPAAAVRRADRVRPRRRPQLPGRREPRPGQDDRHADEAGLPAGRARPHPADGAGAPAAAGATSCSSATSTTPLRRWGRTTRPATRSSSRCRARPGAFRSSRRRV